MYGTSATAQDNTWPTRPTRNPDSLYVFNEGFKLSTSSLGWGETLSGFLLNCLFAPEHTFRILIHSHLDEVQHRKTLVGTIHFDTFGPKKDILIPSS